MKSGQKTWFAVYTKPRHEKLVRGYLTEQEIENYLPIIKIFRKWVDRIKSVEVPMFSSYIFVRINEKDHLKVLKTNGALRFISFEGKKIPVRDIEIDAIRKYEKTGEEIIVNEADFIPGRWVKVIRGQFKGMEGQLIQILGKQRVKIEIEAIGQSVYLKIPIGNLEINYKRQQ